MMTVVCFDLDGTLIDSSAAIHASLQEACHQEGVPPPAYEALVSCIGPPLSIYLPSLLNVSEEVCERILLAFRAHHDVEGFLAYRLYPNAVDILSELEESGHPLYVATNKPYALSRAALCHFGLLGRFLNVYCPDGSLHPSCLPDHGKCTVLKHLKRSSLDAGVVYVGDTASDRDAAIEAGVVFIHANYGYGSDVQWERCLDALSGLLPLIC